MTNAAMNRLAELLASDEPVLLNTDERELIRVALAAVAAGERRVAHLEELLRVHAGGLDEIERAAGVTVAFDGRAYDFGAAAGARADFREKLETARDAKSIVSAALAFARDAAVLVP